MATNEILQFAETDTGTNLLTQAEYLADAQRPIGNQPGVARSKLVNKVLRQSSLIAAAVAQFIADNQTNNVVDTATPADVADWIEAAVRSIGIPTAVAGGTADAITADFTPNVALTNGTTVIVRAGAANTTAAPTFAPDGLTAKTIVKGNNLALVAGDIAGAGHWLEMNFDTTLDKWVLQNPATGITQSSSASIQGNFKKLSISTTGLSPQVSVSADAVSLKDSGNGYANATSVSLTINMAAAAANGLDTGAVAASTWYAIFVIAKADGTVAGLASLSETAPTLPAGYTLSARVGWIRTDGTANKYPLSMIQKGRRVQYVVKSGSNLTAVPTMASGTQTSWTAVAVAAFVPPSACRIITFMLCGLNAGTYTAVAPNASYPTGGAVAGVPIANSVNGGVNVETSFPVELILESSNIYYGSNAGNSFLYCFGWEDNL